MIKTHTVTGAMQTKKYVDWILDKLGCSRFSSQGGSRDFISGHTYQIPPVFYFCSSIHLAAPEQLCRMLRQTSSRLVAFVTLHRTSLCPQIAIA